MPDFKVKSVFAAVDKISPILRRMGSNVSRFSRGFQNEVSRTNKAQLRLNSTLKKTGGLLAGAFAAQKLKAGITDVIRVGAELDNTLRSAAIRFPEGIRPGQEAFEELEETVRGLGATTEFTATQAAEALKFLALAGFNAKQSMAALPKVLDLATASELDLGRASDVATDSLNSFGLAVKDPTQLMKNLSRVMDVYSKTASSSNVLTDALFESFIKGGPIATALGVDLETVAAITGRLAQAGIKGSRAGTTLKNTFTALAEAKNQKIFQALGFSVNDANGEFRDALDILGDLNKGLSKLGKTQRLAALATIFGELSIEGLAGIMTEGLDVAKAYREEIRGAAGTTQDFAKILREGIQVRLKNINSALEAVKLDVFEAALPIIEKVADKLILAFRATALWVKANRDLIEVGLKKTLEVLLIIKDVLFTLGKVILFFAQNPIAKLIAGLLAAVAAFKLVIGVVVALTALALLNPFGAMVVGAIALTAIIKNIPAIFSKIVGFGKRIGGLFRFGKAGEESAAPQKTPLGTQTNFVQKAAQNQAQTQSVLDVNFNNTPENVSIDSQIGLTGLNLNLGRAF